ncbi:MAG: UDP-N-acetylmuramate--L-alanine ligase, partial [candidate division Zixibacteria bacterium]|nr:UDP-N-acetylmuramate--L-alanine ligase [candidate division Zixibacteria bacterium]
MCGIAEVLLNLGYQVSGSDLATTDVTQHLEKLGAKISQGHDASHVNSADALVYSSAVKPDNPEVQAARQNRIPVIPRSEMLAELMRMKFGIAIAGTHGKTTTTSMIGEILASAGLDPTIVVGGKVKNLKSNAKLGKGEYLVAEADEFDRSFLKLAPTMAVITTLESEHLDCYKDFPELEKAFLEFANKVPFYGNVVVCIDDQNVRNLLNRIQRPIITTGVDRGADVTACDLEFKQMHSQFKIKAGGKNLGELMLSVPGLHNVKNALAAAAVGLELEIKWDIIKTSLEKFSGVSRRFEIKGEKNGIMIVDDYAHHPTEIKATLLAARNGWNRRVVAVF